MRSKLFWVSAACVCVASIVCAGSAEAAIRGLWEFEDGGDLTAATVGADLGLTGADAAVAGSGGPDTGGSQLGVGDYYTVSHGIAPNGGGSFVNQYSLLYDVSYPTASFGTWRSIFQTNQANTNDGDYFVHPADESWGVGDLGYTDGNAGTFFSSAETWYRLVLTFDLGNAVKVYVDGNFVGDHSASSLDGRFSLDPTFHIFADNDGEDNTMNVSNFAVWDEVLGPDAIVNLGGAGREIPIPEPSSIGLALLAIVGFLSRRRR